MEEGKMKAAVMVEVCKEVMEKESLKLKNSGGIGGAINLSGITKVVD